MKILAIIPARGGSKGIPSKEFQMISTMILTQDLFLVHPQFYSVQTERVIQYFIRIKKSQTYQTFTIFSFTILIHLKM